MIDIGFSNDDMWFRYRTGAIIIIGDKLLLCKNKSENYYYFVGGGVYHGELSENCVRREVTEETGLPIDDIKLVCIVENFFETTNDSKITKCHVLELYYKVIIKKDYSLNEVRSTTDILEWIDILDIKSKDIRPKEIANNIEMIYYSNSIMHIVNKETK